MSTQPFSHSGPMIELHCEYLSVRSIQLHIIIMVRTHIAVNLQSLLALLETGAISEV